MTDTAVVAPFRMFSVRVRRLQRLSPHFLRVTLTGDDLDRFADNGLDQRIKLITPLPGAGLSAMPLGLDWYLKWRELPDELRNPIRTYTAGEVRPAERELDIDMVLHGATGPASRWAEEAVVGSEAILCGPNADHDGEHGGVDYHPPHHPGFVLLGGDETAVPAIAGVLRRLPADAVGAAFLEIPEAADVLPLAAPEGVRVTWLPRDGATWGEKLIPAIQEATTRIFHGRAGTPDPELADVDVDQDILWEVPNLESTEGGFYAWLAGEASAIKTLRRHLVAECGVDRRSVAFMGYWRHGKAEDN